MRGARRTAMQADKCAEKRCGIDTKTTEATVDAWHTRATAQDRKSTSLSLKMAVNKEVELYTQQRHSKADASRGIRQKASKAVRDQTHRR
ncbi:hypothetical protein A0H81_08982 [Grifola frondosa]|uniref:Uncharacterized protein n=1 Tax=Grifola frondosa TaxID=5627 RepID=A0A1C7M5M2_GRIFR|nr:hypothetical protein A0H81_08982 [Grifola frondosa]